MLLAVAAAAACTFAAAAESATSFSIVGRGFGHGVGMSQYGAQGFAVHGWSYRKILSHYYQGTSLTRVPNAHVRVLVRDERASLVVGASSPLRLTDAGGGTLSLRPGRYELGPELILAVDGTRYRLRPPVRFDAFGAPLSLDGEGYRGSLVVGHNSSGGLYAIDDVQVDDYVRGVVAWEMPSLWNQQALRVQAVAARSYALAERKPDRLFDLFPDTRSQMYGGIRAETAATDEAVQATRGEALTWHGRIAIAFYSSTSGGCTAALPDGMPGAQRLPYLRSVSDPYDSLSPSHAWGPIVVSATRLSAILGLPGISSLRVVRNGSGRVATVVVAYAGGVRDVSGSTFARALGLRSTWFDVDAGRGADGVGGCSAHGKPAELPPPASQRVDRNRRSTPKATATLAAAFSRTSAASPSTGEPPVRLPSLSRLVPALIALLALLGAIGFALADRRVVALCAVALLAGIVVKGPFWKTSRLHPAAVPSSRHDEAPSALTGPARAAPKPPPPAAPKPGAQPTPGSPIPTVPEPVPTAPPPVVTSPPEPRPPASVQTESAPAKAPPAHRPAPGRERPDTQPTPPPVEPPPPSEAPPPPPPAEALAISDVHVDSPPGSRTLTVSWHTNAAAATVGASGVGGTATVWTPADFDRTDHQTVFSNLAPSTPYRLVLYAVDQWDRQQSAELQVVTPPRAPAPTAHSSGTSLLVDGQPFFPIALWALCSSEIETKLSQGVNLFMSSACGKDRDFVHEVAGRALTVVDPATAADGGDGVIGWHYPDEWDNWLPSDVTSATLDATGPAVRPPLITFLTLTNHFYSYAAPLPQGRGMYPVLAQTADVLGFDLYPMQSWCNLDAFAHVYESQRELVRLAAGKPTYQWIEVAPMEHCPQPELAPTAQTVRAETWLAIAGGATGIGYFPNGWIDEIGEEIARTNREIRELTPALLAPETEAHADQAAIKVSARLLNDALYVIAVNSSRSLVAARVDVPQLFGDQLEVYDEQRQVAVTTGTFVDVFEPLQVHIYIAAPQLGAETASEPQTPSEADGALSFLETENPQAAADSVAPANFGPWLP
jgi:stage II sporulation protein D